MSDWKEVFDVTVEIFKVIDGLAKKQNVEENEKIKRQTLNRFLSILGRQVEINEEHLYIERKKLYLEEKKVNFLSIITSLFIILFIIFIVILVIWFLIKILPIVFLIFTKFWSWYKSWAGVLFGDFPSTLMFWSSLVFSLIMTTLVAFLGDDHIVSNLKVFVFFVLYLFFLVFILLSLGVAILNLIIPMIAMIIVWISGFSWIFIPAFWMITGWFLLNFVKKLMRD